MTPSSVCSSILHFLHRVCWRVSCYSRRKQRLFPPLNALNLLIWLREIVYCEVGCYVYIFTHTRARTRTSKMLGQTSGVSSSHQNTGEKSKHMFASTLRSYHDKASTFARPHCRWGTFNPL